MEIQYIPRVNDIIMLALDPSRGGKPRKLDNLHKVVDKASVRAGSGPVSMQVMLRHLYDRLVIDFLCFVGLFVGK
jgi:hypothetical protein